MHGGVGDGTETWTYIYIYTLYTLSSYSSSLFRLAIIYQHGLFQHFVYRAGCAKLVTPSTVPLSVVSYISLYFLASSLEVRSSSNVVLKPFVGTMSF